MARQRNGLHPQAPAQPPRLAYTVLGNPANVAARSGDVVLSGTTLERLGDGVEVEELGELPLADLKQAVAAYRLVG